MCDTLNSVQAKMAEWSHRAGNLLPEEYRGELWVYAAGYVILYTLLLLFRMSTFGFICISLYVILINLLVLRYFGKGPLAGTPRVRASAG